MKKPVVKFFIKIFLFCLPVLLLFSFYIATDPFKVIYHYESYYESGDKPYVALNKDYVSTQTFINNYPKYKYDSFIFGSSRSMFYQVKDWQKHIASKKCFHFDAASESLYGIHAKIKYLDDQKIPIKNALIILDTDALYVTGNTQGHIFLKHPALSGQNRLLFQLEFVKAFFNIKFLTKYIPFRISGKVKKGSQPSDYIVEGKLTEYDPVTNETHLIANEVSIRKNPADYYSDKSHGFYKRNFALNFYPSIIGNQQKKLLKEIFQIFTRHGTEYRIIISPHYNQIEFNANDFKYLSELFGKNNVYDFSGINEITKNIFNYYDWSHYRPHVAKYILDKVYKYREVQ